MSSLAYFILIVVASLAAIYVISRIVPAARIYLTFRGERLVSCPETHEPAAVRIAAGKAAMEATVRDPQLRLSECSRWPERGDCPQECLSQIEEAPKACLVWTIINQWYQGQHCVYCHKPFGEIHWHDHPPALLNRDKKTVAWDAIPAKDLQAALATHLPVCWNCHITETFRREHPDLLVDRPSDSRRMNLYH